MGKGSGKSSSNKIINQDHQEVALGKKHIRELLAKRTSWKLSFLGALLKHRMER